MSSTEPGRADLPARPSDLPEDVRAELDAERRRTQGEPVLSVPAEEMPEDVVAERDFEARLGGEEIRQRPNEGRPPAEAEPSS